MSAFQDKTSFCINQIKFDLQNIDIKNLSLLDGGIGGASLFFYQLYLKTNKKEHLDHCYDLLCHCIDSLNNRNLNYSLFNGYIGIVWYLDFFRRRNVFDYDPNLFSAFDEQLYVESLRQIMLLETNFLHEGSGAVIHALNQLDDPKAVGFLNQYVDIIHSLIQLHGISALRSEEVYSSNTISSDSDILYLINTLADLFKLNIKKELSLVLMEQIVFSLQNDLNNRNMLDKTSLFHRISFTEIKQDELNSLLSVFWVVYRAGVICKKPDWRKWAKGELELLQNKNLIKFYNETNFTLRNGFAGSAYFYLKFFHQTGNNKYLKNHLFWLNKTVTALDSIFSNQYSHKDFSFFDGLLGAGLVLLNTKKNPENQWDHFLLNSL